MSDGAVRQSRDRPEKAARSTCKHYDTVELEVLQGDWVMAIRFSLFGRRTRAPSAQSHRPYGSLNDAMDEAGLLPASEALQNIRARARERLARADQAFKQSADSLG